MCLIEEWTQCIGNGLPSFLGFNYQLSSGLFIFFLSTADFQMDFYNHSNYLIMFLDLSAQKIDQNFTCKKKEQIIHIKWECRNHYKPPKWAISSGNASNKAFVSSGFPAAIFVRHQAASSNCNITIVIIIVIIIRKFSFSSPMPILNGKTNSNPHRCILFSSKL